jgi:hypothetical protein
MKKFTQWLAEFAGTTPMIGGRPVEQIDAQVSLMGNQLTVATKKGSWTGTITPQQSIQFQQQVGMTNAGMPAGQTQLPTQNTGS